MYFLYIIILPCPLPRLHPHHFSKLNFIPKRVHFSIQINAYQEGTKINTDVNERPLKNIGTHWNIKHRLFQRVPIYFSLAEMPNRAPLRFIWTAWCETKLTALYDIHTTPVNSHDQGNRNLTNVCYLYHQKFLHDSWKTPLSYLPATQRIFNWSMSTNNMGTN